MLFRQLFLITFTIFITACNWQDKDDGKVSLDRAYGSIVSSDANYLAIDDEFEHISLTSSLNPSKEEHLYRTKVVSLYSENGELSKDISEWALEFKKDSEFIGTFSVNEIEVNLYNNFFFEYDYSPGPPAHYSRTENSEITYKGVSGWISISADELGQYEIQFQQVTDLETEETSGPIVTVSGSLVHIYSLEI